MNRFQKREQGQVVVFLALAIVGLLGFAALAVDVGMIFADRRYEQSVADASALAAAQAIAKGMTDASINFKGPSGPLCNATTAPNNTLPTIIAAGRQKAITQAATNKVAYNPYPAPGASNKLEVSVVCVNQSAFNQYVEVTVMVTAQTNTSFVHLMFGGKVINTVTAKTQVKPKYNAGFGNSIVAFKNNTADEINSNGKEIWFTGGGNAAVDHITIRNGGVYSNGGVNGNGNVEVEVVNSGGTIIPNSILYNLGSAFVQPSGGSVTPNPFKLTPTATMPIPPVKPPDCGTQPASPPQIVSHGNQTVNVTPGWYSGTNITGGTVNLAPGAYCFTGSFSVGSATVNGGNGTNGTGVTIYMKNGSFQLGSQSNAYLYAATNSTNPPAQGAAVNGLLVYVDPTTNSCNVSSLSDTGTPGSQACIDVAGGATQFLTGTLLAPHGFVDFGGNPDMNCSNATQIMGWYLKVHGSTDLCVNYDEGKLLTFPTTLDLVK